MSRGFDRSEYRRLRDVPGPGDRDAILTQDPLGRTQVWSTPKGKDFTKGAVVLSIDGAVQPIGIVWLSKDRVSVGGRWKSASSTFETVWFEDRVEIDVRRSTRPTLRPTWHLGFGAAIGLGAWFLRSLEPEQEWTRWTVFGALAVASVAYGWAGMPRLLTVVVAAVLTAAAALVSVGESLASVRTFAALAALGFFARRGASRVIGRKQ